MHKVYENDDLMMYFKKDIVIIVEQYSKEKGAKGLFEKEIRSIGVIVTSESVISHMVISWL